MSVFLPLHTFLNSWKWTESQKSCYNTSGPNHAWSSNKTLSIKGNLGLWHEGWTGLIECVVSLEEVTDGNYTIVYNPESLLSTYNGVELLRNQVFPTSLASLWMKHTWFRNGNMLFTFWQHKIALLVSFFRFYNNSSLLLYFSFFCKHTSFSTVLLNKVNGNVRENVNRVQFI